MTHKIYNILGIKIKIKQDLSKQKAQSIKQ